MGELNSPSFLRSEMSVILKDMGRKLPICAFATPDERINVLHDLSKRKLDWLINAAQSMARATKRDWESFQSSQLAMVGGHHPHAAYVQ